MQLPHLHLAHHKLLAACADDRAHDALMLRLVHGPRLEHHTSGRVHRDDARVVGGHRLQRRVVARRTQQPTEARARTMPAAPLLAEHARQVGCAQSTAVLCEIDHATFGGVVGVGGRGRSVAVYVNARRLGKLVRPRLSPVTRANQAIHVRVESEGGVL